MNKNTIHNRIDSRVHNMIHKGLIQEAEMLYPYRKLRSLHTIGYREIFQFFKERKNKLDTIIEKIKTNTKKYAKKQNTWYKRDPNIIWVPSGDKEKILKFILNEIKKMGNTGFEPVTSCL